MRTAFFIGLLVFLTGTPVHSGTPKKDPMAVEMIEGASSKPFSLIAPVSADKKDVDDAFMELRKAAAKLNADAVINYTCRPGESYKGGGLFGIANKGRTNAQCMGKAVKWTQPDPNSQTQSPIQADSEASSVAK